MTASIAKRKCIRTRLYVTICPILSKSKILQGENEIEERHLAEGTYTKYIVPVIVNINFICHVP